MPKYRIWMLVYLMKGLLELKFNNSWRYQPGDNLEWASPDFDDSKWQDVNPIGLKAYQMPDSLWIGVWLVANYLHCRLKYDY
jgi:hypothetical protein